MKIRKSSEIRTKARILDKRGHVIVEGLLLMAGFLLFVFMYLQICKEGARAINHFRNQAEYERNKVDRALQKITNKKMVDTFSFDRVFSHSGATRRHER